MRRITRVEVGMADGKVGLRLEYDEGVADCHLFDLAIAEQIAAQMTKAVADLRYLDTVARGIPHSNIGVSDSCSMGLTEGG